MTAILVIFTIALLLTIDYSAERLRKRRGVPVAEPSAAPVRFRELEAAVPGGLFLAPSHTWLQIEPGGTVRIGGDALWGGLLGEVDRVELRPEGASVNAGDWVARLVHGERSLEVRAPVDGEVEAVNPELQHAPDRLRDEPYGRGWLLRLTPREIGKAVRSFRIGEEAGAWMRAELGRLADLVAGFSGRGAQLGATLHDGGVPAAGVAAYLDDAAWQQLTREMFETRQNEGEER